MTDKILEWLRRRQKGLGGSDIPVITHDDPRKTEYELALEKTADPALLEEPPRDPATITDLDVGNAIQSGLVQLTARRFGLTGVQENVMVEHPDNRILRGSLDAAFDGGLIEVKTLGEWSPDRYGEGAEGIPARHQLQTWWYQMIRKGFAIIAIFDRGRLSWRIVEQDPVMGDCLAEIGLDWWDRVVVRGVMPPMTFSPKVQRMLQRQYPTHKRPDIRPAEKDELELLTEYLWLRINLDEMEVRRRNAEVTLQKTIADREGIRWPDGQVTWRRTKDSQVIDWESMSRGLLNEFVEDPVKRQELLDFYTRTKEGSRRFLLTSKLRTKQTREEEAA